MQISNLLFALDDVNRALNINGTALLNVPPELLSSFAEVVLSQMNDQQYDEIFNYVSFKVVTAVKGVANNTVTISTPLTASEVSAGRTSDTLSMAANSSATSARVSLVMTRLSTLDTTLQKLVHSNPLTVVIPDLSVCPAGGCALTLTMETVDQTRYSNSSDAAVVFSTQCEVGNITRHSYSCPFNETVTALCDGLDNVNISTTCPYKVTEPSCHRIIGTALVDDVCQTVSYTPFSTTCLCLPPNGMLSDPRNMQRRLANSGAFRLGVATVEKLATPGTRAPAQSPTPRPIAKYVDTYGKTSLSLRSIVLLGVLIPALCLLCLLCLLVALRYAYGATPEKKADRERYVVNLEYSEDNLPFHDGYLTSNYPSLRLMNESLINAGLLSAPPSPPKRNGSMPLSWWTSAGDKGGKDPFDDPSIQLGSTIPTTSKAVAARPPTEEEKELDRPLDLTGDDDVEVRPVSTSERVSLSTLLGAQVRPDYIPSIEQYVYPPTATGSELLNDYLVGSTAGKNDESKES